MPRSSASEASEARRDRRRRETGARLRRVALELFVRKGFRETSIAEITRAAGVATGTFYLYYPNKEAIVDEAFADFNLRLAEALRACVPATPPPRILGRDPERRRAVLARLAAAYLGGLVAERELIRIFSERLAGQVTLAMLRDGVSPPLLALAEGLLAELLPKLVAPRRRLLAHALLATWQRTALQLLYGEGLDQAEAEAFLVEASEALLASFLEA